MTYLWIYLGGLLACWAADAIHHFYRDELDGCPDCSHAGLFWASLAWPIVSPLLLIGLGLEYTGKAIGRRVRKRRAALAQSAKERDEHLKELEAELASIPPRPRIAPKLRDTVKC